MPDLSFLFAHAGHVLATEMHARLAEIDLTPRGQCVLTHAQQGEFTQIQLAEQSALDKTTMVLTVDELEKRGLAERHPSPTDRRARIIAVTDTGLAKAAEGARVVDEVHRDVLAAIPEAEREAFVRNLELLVGGRLSTPVESGRPVRRGGHTGKG
ncbi:MarR family winged helix-turn-helix transcriptional regulator [Yinghuangia seranimata]|uniref:MarR family winged helix-turn-helix transcriptional regulator n=1 Tax=Yinghuangia seranimata TaxID=408067 RepID=UPI00248B121E|nr:MarR family winged helix-turn-helix transcriptional regulator [Yinghuangia seranimata]MDI2126979.1 MarR family winged helix-turn-helix transcriptional regulator [Yinghuangia seranimata]